MASYRLRDFKFHCHDCGIELENNDKDTIWLGPSWDDREPYCRGCQPYIERRLWRG